MALAIGQTAFSIGQIRETSRPFPGRARYLPGPSKYPGSSRLGPTTSLYKYGMVENFVHFAKLAYSVGQKWADLASQEAQSEKPPDHFQDEPRDRRYGPNASYSR